MNEWIPMIAAAIVCSGLFCCMTLKAVGAMQQGGYKNRMFLRWFKRGDNLYFNRLCVLALCLALVSAVTSLGFSMLGVKIALYVSAVPFIGLLVVFLAVDLKYALKVPVKYTGRFCRLFAVYLFFTACVSFGFLYLLSFLSSLNGSEIYALISFIPYSLMPILLPFLLCAANGVTRIFENARNEKYAKRAGQVLNERKIIRVGVVGSFGKTTVKNILKALLSVKYDVAETPASYNTPVGIAKTVFSEGFDKKEVFIAEMGARKQGDVAELCALVKPDYAVFTGVCEQHISSFKSLDNVFGEKSEILKCGATVVCGESLRERITETFGENSKGVVYPDPTAVQNLHLSATETKFDLKIGGKSIPVLTKLLGFAAVENVLLAATLAYEMGLTAEEIAKGLENIPAIPHRLQLIESNGTYILDDGYNSNPRGAKEALAALSRFSGRKCIVTPGIVECGVLEEKINAELGRNIAAERLDKVILIGDTLIGAVKKGYAEAGGEESKLVVARSLEEAKPLLAEWVCPGDAVLFLNDLPDVY
ncbi:MAG: UDP-N-acetylmuramoyl-tripeptide--D-alanyl-D-alanine ligase [Clostridia bacterium]|nr:UDP-N-acetylmuramoyl-tripeptide--D-alanyl-D-alanine ligase [Clostridia bacterium]